MDWYSFHEGIQHVELNKHIVRAVTSLCCSVAACERVNSAYQHLIGLGRVRTKNERAKKLLYIYLNRRARWGFEKAKLTSMEPCPLPNIFQDDEAILDFVLDDFLSRDALNAAEFTVDEQVHEILNVCGDVTTEEELNELLSVEKDCNGGAAADIPSDDDAEWETHMEDTLHAEVGLLECHVSALEAALEVAEDQLEEEVATKKCLRHKSPEESEEEEDFDDR